ncbi:hypothetical protein LCGC14_0414100 [marine sediment metagenome]|uniref:Uncharacterized protein n=1 Tax=marine sediment metagenome TaxID=412755 RepID=A0A0F9SYV8_9ZZZZ
MSYTQLDDDGTVILRPVKMKLTKKIQNKILHAVYQGATISILCRYAGVSRDTFRGWLEKGVQDLQADDRKTVEAEFALRFATMEAEAAESWLSHINAAAPEDWRAAAWLLERRFRDDYGKEIKVKSDSTTPILVVTGIPGPPGSNLKKLKPLEEDK